MHAVNHQHDFLPAFQVVLKALLEAQIRYHGRELSHFLRMTRTIVRVVVIREVPTKERGKKQGGREVSQSLHVFQVETERLEGGEGIWVLEEHIEEREKKGGDCETLRVKAI